MEENKKLAAPTNPKSVRAGLNFSHQQEGGLQMNCAEIAHHLKVIGDGKEAVGLVKLYRTGQLVGAGKVGIAVLGAAGIYGLGCWGYKKLVTYKEEHNHLPIEAAGSVQ